MMNIRHLIDVIEAGGEGSGCDPAVAEANGTRCGRPPGSGTQKDSMDTFKNLKAKWANVNNELLAHLDRPDSPEAQRLMNELRDIVKDINKLDVDPGGWEGVGLPGGARDILIIGGGPGGLAAAMMGASDGLDTLLIEAQDKVGGQAKYSSRVENYPGFPIGVTGNTLAGNMHDQATRLGAETKLNTRVVGLDYDDATGLKTVKLSNGEEVTARAVVIAGGVEFRKLSFPGSESKSVVYGDGETLKQIGAGKPVVVVGGSNGAAQAALGVAQQASHVYVISRNPIVASMSDYQVQAVKNNPKITVIENDSIQQLFLDEHGSAKELHTAAGKKINTAALGIFVGSAPKTDWLPMSIGKTSGKLNVNHDLETSIPGVFAVGDIRTGGIGRIGGAVGDGQLAERNVFQYFNREKAKRQVKAAAKRRRPVSEFNALIDRLFDLDARHPYIGQTIERKRSAR